YAVPALSIPPAGSISSLDALARFEAVQLFTIRMKQHTPDFELNAENASPVVEICRRMEGIPLALELAAATARRMPLAEITQMLHPEAAHGWLRRIRSPAQDLPPRQRTLYNAIAWSYNLLDPTEQAVFRSLGVFTGSFDRPAGVAVCQGAVPDQESIDPVLEKLVGLYLLTQAAEASPEPRWRMLEMVREFALEILAETAELQDRQRRHALYFAGQLAGLNTISAYPQYMLFSLSNAPNLYAALDWAIQAQAVPLAISLVGSLEWLWESQGLQQEGLQWTRKALALPGEAPAPLYAAALFGAANLAWQTNRYDQALAWTQKGIALARERHLPLENLIPLLNQLGRIYIQQSRHDLARQALEECLHLARQSPDLYSPGRPLAQLGEIVLAEGRFEEARRMLSEALSLLREDDHLFQATTLINLAEAALAQRDDESARNALILAFPAMHLHFGPELRYFATFAGFVLSASGKDEQGSLQAVQLLGAFENLSRRSGYQISPWAQRLVEQRLDRTRQILTRSEWERAWSSGSAWTKEDTEAQ
ncbi:MAG TPA: tetratricopeptide repeat protein, partial [Anaerolineales bacterium]